jgi:hypothetical protein
MLPLFRNATLKNHESRSNRTPKWPENKATNRPQRGVANPRFHHAKVLHYPAKLKLGLLKDAVGEMTDLFVGRQKTRWILLGGQPKWGKTRLIHHKIVK